jgi:polo-like kinase 1
MTKKEDPFFIQGTVITDPNTLMKYTLEKMIGRGAFAQVYLSRTMTNCFVALKIVRHVEIKSQKVRDKLESEMSIHMQLDHPRIVKMYSHFRDEVYTYLILEFCPNKALDDLLRKHGKFKEKYVRRFVHQIVSALMYLHNERSVVHRDLKLGNLFLDSNCSIKIGDFGLSAVINQGQKKRTICGTPNYIAPEVLFDRANGHSFEADVWSLGVIMYTLLVGIPPFQKSNIKEIYENIKHNSFTLPSNLTSEAADLISKVLTTNPLERLTLEEILNHPFMAKKEGSMDRIYNNIVEGRYIEMECDKDYILFSIPVSKIRGIGYILKSGVYGLYMSDHTSMLLVRNRLVYIEVKVEQGRKVYRKEEHLTTGVPEELGEKYTRLKYFVKNFGGEYEHRNIETSFIVKYKRLSDGMLFGMHNGVLEFDFNNGCRVVIWNEGKRVHCFDFGGIKKFCGDIKNRCLEIISEQRGDNV